MANYLEIDSKILEKNLLLKKEASDAENLENFFRSPENYLKNDSSWKLVTPNAGFCVKTTDSHQKKVFINLCKLDEIPEPRDVSEAELLELWQSEDVPDYRIPLSIQEPHEELDKSGNPVVAYDVAVNSKFFERVRSSGVFRSFVMQVVFEGIENKFGVELKKEGYVILQNRKSLGELKQQRIRMGKSPGASKPLIEEVHPVKKTSSSEAEIEDRQKTPAFRLFENQRTGFLIGEFYLPNLVVPEDVSLDVNDNRIVLNSRRGLYSADIFIPTKINENETTACFDSGQKILSVKMPLISAPG